MGIAKNESTHHKCKVARASHQVRARPLTEKGLKACPIEDRLYRLRAFFTDEALLLADLTRATCAATRSPTLGAF